MNISNPVINPSLVNLVAFLLAPPLVAICEKSSSSKSSTLDPKCVYQKHGIYIFTRCYEHKEKNLRQCKKKGALKFRTAQDYIQIIR